MIQQTYPNIRSSEQGKWSTWSLWPRDQTHISCVPLRWQVDSLPTAPPGIKPDYRRHRKKEHVSLTESLWQTGKVLSSRELQNLSVGTSHTDLPHFGGKYRSNRTGEGEVICMGNTGSICSPPTLSSPLPLWRNYLRVQGQRRRNLGVEEEEQKRVLKSGGRHLTGT